MNYLYNGVEFPDINPVWTDKVTYPYVIIFAHTFTNTVTGLTETYYTLWFLDNAPYVIRNEGTSSSIAGGAIIQSYKLTGGNWEYYTTHEWPAAFTYKFDSVIYANFDLLDSDGTLYLAASEPVPVIEVTIPRKVDRYSYIVGFNLGLAGMAYPYSAPAPVAYLYNGVRLPALPEWDREMYPYAYISDINNDVTPGEYFILVICSELPIWGTTTGTVFYNKYVAQGNVIRYKCYPSDNGQWVDVTGYSFAIASKRSDQSDYMVKAIWSNTETKDYNGSLLLSASDPVPVYE